MISIISTYFLGKIDPTDKLTAIMGLIFWAIAIAQDVFMTKFLFNLAF